MSIRLEPRSRKFFFRFVYEGKDFSKGGFETEKQAISAEAILQHRLKEGKVPASRNVLTFAEGVEIWYKTNPPDKARQTLVNERARFAVAQKFFENKKLNKLRQIHREDVEEFLSSLSTLRQKSTNGREYTSRSKHTVNHYFALLRAFFNRLRDRKAFFGDSPCEGIKKMKINEARIRYLLPYEEKILTPIVENDREVYPYYVVGLLTGCRIGELLRMRVQDVDLILNRLFVGAGADGTATKSRRSRYVPISDELSVYLATLIKGKALKELLLPNWSYPFITRRLREMVNEASLAEPLPFHCLRHTFAQRLLTKGVSIYKVSKILGHSSVVVTEKHYGHLAHGDLAEEINLISGVVSGVAETLQRVAERPKAA